MLAWIRRKWNASVEREMERHYPTAAWVSQFDTPEELGAAIARGEGPGAPDPR